jgi:hypothetical protein
MRVGQSAHGEIALPPAATDGTALTEARVYIMNTMKEWIGMTQ